MDRNSYAKTVKKKQIKDKKISKWNYLILNFPVVTNLMVTVIRTNRSFHSCDLITIKSTVGN